ncbi:MAG: SCO family protein [Alphaproteobacteria bacterium]|nr:SCO family protein [Alphaproteobacteria bacterium]
MRRHLPVLLLAALLLPGGPACAADNPFDEAAALADSQAAIGREIADLGFVNSRGQPVRLRDYRGKPVVLNMVYTSCGDTCPLVIEHIARAVQVADAAFGRGRFSVLTAGFDARSDTPKQLRAYADMHGIDRDGWEFLSASTATIDRLAADTGFRFIPRAGAFDHTTQVTLIDQEGRVYRQIYGEDFSTQALVEPLKQLVYGQREALSVASLINRFRLLCTVYDPNAGRYRFSYAVFIEIAIGAASLLGVAVFVTRLWRQARRA